MKLVLKNTHVNVEISPEDIPAAALDGVLEAIRQGWPINYDVIEGIIRAGRKLKNRQ
jgi:hypothetical protein